MKTCTKCNKDKLLEDFNKNESKWCKTCQDAANAKYDPLLGFKINLKRYYGMSYENYAALQEQQDNRCAICGNQETGLYWRTKNIKRLCVDHNHETKQIRGLLCTNCNHGLGKFHENPELLEKAIQYLKKYNK